MRGTSAVVNAAIDALAPMGITALDMPMTPERLWRAIRAFLDVGPDE